jgi:uncharacterized membrane protein HdeD (DUF308 family)
METPTEHPEVTQSDSSRNDRKGRVTGGIILVVLGVLFLLQNFFPWFRFEQFWPVILIVIGLVLLFRSRKE